MSSNVVRRMIIAFSSGCDGRGEGHDASNEKPLEVGAMLLTTICMSCGLGLLTTSMVGRPTTSGKSVGSTVTCPAASCGFCGSMSSVTRAALLLSTGPIVTLQISPAVAGTPSGGTVTVKVKSSPDGQIVEPPALVGLPPTLTKPPP